MRGARRPAISVRAVAAIALLAVFSWAGCSQDNAPKEVTLPGGSMSAKVDGKNWTATLAVTSANTSGIFAAAGTGDGITIGFGGFAQEGEQKIEDGLGANANYTEGYTSQGSWVSSPGTGTGSINIQSISATGASGTFSFVASPAPGASVTGTKTITDGKFNVKFNIGSAGQ